MDGEMNPTAMRFGARKGAALDLAIWLVGLALLSWAASLVPHTAAKRALLMALGAPAQMLALFAVATVLLRRRGERWRDLGLAAPAAPWRVAALVVGGYVAAVAINAVLVLVVLPAFHIALPAFTAFGGLKGHPWTFAYWLLLAWASAALGEELQFRGFLFSRLERLFGGVRGATALAVVAQAVLFGLGHFYQGWGGVLATGALGLLFGGLFLLAPRNLVPGMVLHGLVDTVSLTALYLGVNPGAMR